MMAFLAPVFRPDKILLGGKKPFRTGHWCLKKFMGLYPFLTGGPDAIMAKWMTQVISSWRNTCARWRQMALRETLV
jgi:hypothetical protein